MPRPSLTEADASETSAAEGAAVSTSAEVVANEASASGPEATADRVALLRERLLREKLLQTPPLPRGTVPVSEVDRFLAEDSNREALQSLRDEVNGRSAGGNQVKVKTVAKNSLFGAPAPQARRASIMGASSVKNSLAVQKDRQHGRERSRDRRQPGRDRSRDHRQPGRESSRPAVPADAAVVRPAPERSSLRSSATGFLEVVNDVPSKKEAEVAKDGPSLGEEAPAQSADSQAPATSADPTVATESAAAASSSSSVGKRAVRGRGTARYADGAGDSATLRSLGGAEAEDNCPLPPCPTPSRVMWRRRTVSRSRRRSSSRRRKRSRSRSTSRSRRRRSRSSSSSRSRGRRKSSEERRKSRSRSRSRRRKGRSNSRSRKRSGRSKSRNRKRKANSRSRSQHKRNSKGRSSSRSHAERPPAAPQPAAASAAAAAATSVVAYQPLVPSAITKEEQQEMDRFKPYSPVVLCNLIKNMELNGQCGLVVPQGCSITPDVPGCLKVRLEYGREVAVKPQNLQFLHIQQQQQQFVQTPSAMQVQQHASQEQVLQHVLAQMQAEAAAQRAPLHVQPMTLGIPSAMV